MCSSPSPASSDSSDDPVAAIRRQLFLYRTLVIVAVVIYLLSMVTIPGALYNLPMSVGLTGLSVALPFAIFN